MAPHIFITGITGYIGGQTLATIVAKHPEYTITGLVRKEEQKQQLLATYPSIEITIGDGLQRDLDRAEQHCRRRPPGRNHLTPHWYFIRQERSLSPSSGTASILDHRNGHGKLSSKVWDDVEDLTAITSFEESVFHAKADQLVLGLGKKLKIKTALLEPPVVYGNSESIRDRSITLPALVDAAKARGKMFQIGEAQHVTSSIHVKDLADVLVFFVEEALKCDEAKVEWGDKGVYYIEAQEYIFADIVDAVAKEMLKRGVIETDEVEVLSADEALEIHPWALILWGSNMRVSATRLRAWGWVPKQLGILETLSGLAM